MRYLRQLCIILAITCAAELLHHFIPLPVPASIYGLLIMLGLLISGLLKVSQVKETAGFLIEIMPVMFIPAAAGLAESWSVLQPILVPALIAVLVITVLVIAATGLTAQAFTGKEDGQNERNQ